MNLREVKFNRYLDYNEKNFGLVKLHAKYPEESEEQIYTRFFGRKRIMVRRNDAD